MLFPVPHKKMEKVNRFGFIAKCDCGHVHRFKSKEINLEKSNASTVQFIKVYECPKCGQTYDGIFENISTRSKYSITGISITIVLVLGLLGGGYYILNKMFAPSQPNDIEHATNKQLNDFYKWDHKQQQQKQDNSPAFNNK
jgi:hypothetical protein